MRLFVRLLKGGRQVNIVIYLQNSMILENEDRKREYKASSNKIPNDIWETYSAFANTIGGTIILGISEPKPRKYEITGVKNANLRIQEFWKLITNPQKISVNLLNEEDVYIKNVEGKDLIIINVPEAPYNKKPVYINGHKELCFKRIGEEDKKATEEEFKYMIINSSDDIDNILLENFDIEDLNKKDIIAYRDLLIENTGNEKYIDMNIEDFLKDLGVLKRNRKNLKKNSYLLTVGGLLFFGKYNSIIDYYPNFQLDFLKKYTVFDTDWIDRISTGDKDYPDLNIFSFYIKVMEKLTQSIENRFNLNKDMSRDSFLYDMNRMLREAFTNTLVHAYYAGKTSIKITNYNDYWEFFNPGNMKISKEEFIHGGTSKIRNSIISILFRRIGFVERAGSGGPRIFDTVNKYNLRSPDIYSSDTETTIKIWKLEPMAYYQNRNDIEKKILEIILKNNFITKSLAIKNNISDHLFRTNIKKLIDDEIIVQEGKGRNIKYELKHTEEALIQNVKKTLIGLSEIINKPE